MGTILLSIALGCARSRTPDGEGGRDGAVGSDGSIDPLIDGGRDTRDGAPIDPDPTRDAGRTRDGGRTRDAGPPPSPEVLELARLECLNEARCDPNVLGVGFFDGLDGCIAAMAERLEPVLARGHAAPTSQWCLTMRAADANCDGFRDDDGRYVLDCVEPAGRLRSGDACLDDVECGRSATGGEMHCLDCQCRPLLREGDPGCVSAACETDLYCVSGDPEPVCARSAALPVGAACSDDDPSMWCAHGNRCADGVCVRQPRHGEVCVPGGEPCFDPYYRVGDCGRDDDGVHRCRHPEPVRPAVPPGARCVRTDTCAGGMTCPPEGICPSDCTDGERTCAVGACNEATGECAFPRECVDG